MFVAAYGAGAVGAAVTLRGLKPLKAATLRAGWDTADGGGLAGRFAGGCGVERAELDWLVEGP